jgi:DNA-directed RNA polymerase specialized sigma24 family protein
MAKVTTAEVLDLLDEGLSDREVAGRLEVSEATVARHRKKAGRYGRVMEPLSAAKRAKIEQALEDGWSFNDISQTYGVHVETLRKYYPGRAWSVEHKLACARAARDFWADYGRYNYAAPKRDVVRAERRAA